MANKPKQSVRFYTRSKKPPTHIWKEISYFVVVSYDHKRLTIPGGNYTPALWYAEFSQLNSDGTPKNPDTASSEVLDASKRLIEARRYYEAALSLIIDNGLWDNMDANGFKTFLFYHGEDILTVLDPKQKTWKPMPGFNKVYDVKPLRLKRGKGKA